MSEPAVDIAGKLGYALTIGKISVDSEISLQGFDGVPGRDSEPDRTTLALTMQKDCFLVSCSVKNVKNNYKKWTN
jgi:hypothetical protein